MPIAASVHAERAAAQLLSGPPARTPEQVTGQLLAIQGQDPRGARLAIRARSTGLSAAAVDHALTVDRSLLITWLNRGTLHLVCTPDYWVLHQLTTPPMHTAVARRLGQEGVPPGEAERGVAVIERELTSDGPLTRAQLAAGLTAAGVRTDGQALIHLLYLAALRGIAVRGPMIGKQHAYVLVRDWLGTPPAPADRDVALGWLARRYLAGHAPADDRDLAKWAGLPLRDARRGFAELGAALVQREDGLAELAAAGGGTVAGAAAGGTFRRVAGEAELPVPRLLGSFDPVLHGWMSRAAVLGEHESTIVTGGMFRPFAMTGGRAVATWGVSGKQVTLSPLEELDGADLAALEEDAVDVRRFLGLG